MAGREQLANRCMHWCACVCVCVWGGGGGWNRLVHATWPRLGTKRLLYFWWPWCTKACALLNALPFSFAIRPGKLTLRFERILGVIFVKKECEHAKYTSTSEIIMPQIRQQQSLYFWKKICVSSTLWFGIFWDFIGLEQEAANHLPDESQTR